MITIFIFGNASGVQAMLAHLQNKLSPPNLGAFLLGQVDPYLRNRVADRFAAEGDDVSGKWLPLQPATETIRASQGYSPAHPINRRTDEMRDHLLYSASGVSMGVAGTTLTYPGNAPSGELEDKMTTAQVGRSYPDTPARPVLGMNQNDLAAILTLLANEIQGP